MSHKKHEVTEPTPARELSQDELALVAGGWVEVVKGSDGAPGCVVVHPGPGPRVA